MSRIPNAAPEGYVPKITMKGIGCIPTGSDTPTNQCVVFGRVVGLHSEAYDSKIDPDNIWTCLVGEFVADRAGMQYRSARLFLPKGIQDVLEVAVSAAQAESKVVAVDFAFLMQTVKSSSPAGYQWIAAALIAPTKKDDPITEIRRQLAAGEAKLLEAPAPRPQAERDVVHEPVPEPAKATARRR
jgi:hypothetical protein